MSHAVFACPYPFKSLVTKITHTLDAKLEIGIVRS